jgi:hypothetical protein
LRRGIKIEFLRYPHKTLLFTRCCQINPWNQSYPYFVVTDILYQSDIAVVSTTILDSHKLVYPQLTVFGLIIFVHHRHFFSRHQNILVQDEMEAFTSLPDMNFLKSFHKDVALGCVTACHRQDAQGVSLLLEVDALIK